MVISHPCVLPSNQQLFAEVERMTGWELRIVVPERWRHDYGCVSGGQRWPSLRGGVRTIPVWFQGNIPLHLYRPILARYIRRERPDAMYVHHEPYALATWQWFSAARACGRFPVGFYAAQNIYKLYPFPFSRMERWVMRKAAFAIAVSKTASDILSAKGYRGPTHVLPLSVDPAIYRKTVPAAEVLALRRPGGVLVGYIGRLAEEKGLATLVRAAALLRDIVLDMVIVGNGPFGETMERMTSELKLQGRVHRLGYVPHDETPAYYSAFDLLVLPSETRGAWKEQFGRVILESLACGTPVVGASSGEIPHVLDAVGGGVIFPEGNHEALALAIRRLASDPYERARLAQTGSINVAKHFSHTRVAQRFADSITAAVAECRRNEQ